MKIDWEKGDGLVPAIVQDAATRDVLMLGYMNAEALAQTQESGLVTFWSRSKQRLWTKGETSGNHLKLRDIRVDCDNDTLLIQATPIGPTCHTGDRTCWGDDAPDGVGFLSALETVISGRKSADPAESYTAKLLSGPMHKTAQKVGEEGVEVALAAVAEDDAALAGEAADLIYHLLVVLAARDVELAAVMDVLRERHAK